MDFSCVHCNAVFTGPDALDNYTRAIGHVTSLPSHAVVDENRYILQRSARMHGIKA